MGKVSQEEFKQRLKFSKTILIKTLKERPNNLFVKCIVCNFEWKSNICNLRNHSCRACSTKRAHDKQKMPLARAIEIYERANVKTKSEFKSSNASIIAECIKCNHLWKTNTSRLTKHSCIKCASKKRANKRRYNQSQIIELLKGTGVTYISGYISSRKPIKVKHEKCGHITTHQLLYNLRRGDGCSKCFFITKKDYENYAKKHKGQIISIAQNTQKKSKWKCENGCVFYRTFNEMKRNNAFCNKCSRRLGERFCRKVFEDLFDVEFDNFWVDNLRGLGGGKLELDMYNDELKIAIEHQGIHHFNTRNAWDNEERLEKQKVHDKLKREFCKKEGIKLFEIPELFTLTPIDELANLIQKQALKLKIQIKKNINLVVKNTSVIGLTTETQKYLKKFLDELSLYNYIFLEEGYRGSHSKHKLKCDNGHLIEISPDKFFMGRRCKNCLDENREIAVIMSNGLLFEKVVDCAKYFGVSSGTVSSATARNHKLGNNLAAISISKKLYFQLNKDKRKLKFYADLTKKKLSEIRDFRTFILLEDGSLFNSQLDMAKKLNINQSSISATLQGKEKVVKYKSRKSKNPIRMLKLNEKEYLKAIQNKKYLQKLIEYF